MFRKVLFLAGAVSVLMGWNAKAAVINSTWIGGDKGSWGYSGNWNPNIVPDNSASDTFNVSISNARIWLSEYHDPNISSLSIDGDVELWSRFVRVFRIEHSSLSIGAGDSLQLSDIHVESNGAVSNYGFIDFQHRSLIKEDLVNYGNINISSISEAGIEGELTNNGTVSIAHSSHFNANEGIQNYALFGIYGGLGVTDEVMNNNPAGTLQGFGLFYADQAITNEGQITAWGGSLTVATGGTFTNTGLIQSTELSPLLISPYMSGTPGDFNNLGTIEIQTGGGVAFECNLVNDANGVIELLGGTLAATTITQSQGGTFQGFGSIAGEVIVEPNGIIELTAPTNIVGDITIGDGATLEVSDGTTIITGHTTCNNGTIHMVGGRVICQGGLTNNGCEIVWEPGIDSNAADYNLDGRVNLEDYAQFAKTWLWEASWR